jgi:hypothetical protein
MRKVSEPPHLDELEQLQELARNAPPRTPLYVGLFDKYTDTFYRAILLDCIFSKRPTRAPESGNKTPAYYRKKPLAAWLKLKTIDDLSRDVFIRLFGSVPIGEETFWEVDGKAKSAALDSSGLWAGAPLLRSNVIAHLSDIHFGSDYGFPDKRAKGKYPLLDILRRDIEKTAPDGLGLLIISGDLITHAKSDLLFQHVKPFLLEATKALKIDPEHVVIVPGNHDLPLKDYELTDYSHESTFREFLTNFYKAETTLSGLRRFRLPSGNRLEMLLINSVRLRKKEESNFGFVEWGLYDPMLAASPHDPDVLRMAVMHHHLVPAPREEHPDPEYPQASLSATVDSGAVLEGLQSHGFRLVIHGHQHVPAISKIARGATPHAGERIGGLDDGVYVVAAGSAGSKRLTDAMRDNCYNVLTLKKDKRFVVEARRFTPSEPNVSRWFLTHDLR